ncbi:hypothetical protein [Virgisporangium aurantiacum]|uniref:Uncharacterized protein n=1 Tax=Virgisporangium aurantiacum TaxID=175570 RepID=A0A8J4E257_9ACTN|nr:hypothetical protein [Virgisporangium aurantiacum]GIJ58631.1 hypothetical protein Vau01_061470 [Virgisporangium aurantiacum]
MNPRLLQWVFAAYAAIATCVLLTGSGPAFFRVMGIAGYAIGAVVSVIAVRRWERGGRRIAIVAHLALAPLQFVFSIGSSVTLIGIVISLLILARSRPRFPRLSPRARRVWLVLHVGFSVGWLGVALTMTVLALVGQFAGSHGMRYGAYEVLHVVDLAAAIPSMALSIVTGLVVSLGSKWGLVRYRWVLTKFAISLSIPMVAGSVESSLADDLVVRTADPAARPGGAGLALTACLGAFVVALWVATVLSVVKPWGRTRWGTAGLSVRRARGPGADDAESFLTRPSAPPR